MKVTRHFKTDFDAGSFTPDGPVGTGAAFGGGIVATSVTDGVTTVIPTSQLDFTSGATVTDAGGGVAHIAVATFSNPMTTEGDMIYQHSSAPTRLAVGGTNTVLHGGTDPSYSAVVEADITLANNTTNNVSITKHGFAPIAPNDATKYLDGTGAYSVPAGGGGGISQSFVGYNTVGGTWTTITASRYYLKQITLASAATFTSIDAYLRPNIDNVANEALAVILSDSGGSPSVLFAGASLLGPNGIYLSNSSSMPGAGRWLSFPIGAHLASGTYWIGIAVGAGAGNFQMANDGSGSDVTFTVTGGLLYLTGAYPSAWALSVGSVQWSIRASILS